MEFTKLPLSIQAQIELLASRGLVIPDRVTAANYLKQIGYYRISAYAIPFEASRHIFKAEITLTHIHDLYEFDRQFRLLMSEALEIIEVACRTMIATGLALRHGAFAHEQPELFYDAKKYAEWHAGLLLEIERSKETFIDHYKTKYDGFPRIPLWMASEVMSFGSLSRLYANLLRGEQQAIAAEFGLHSAVLKSWLHAFTYVRNLCAHHSRLWNRMLAITIVVPKRGAWSDIDNRHIGAVIMALATVLRQVAPLSDYPAAWQRRMEELLAVPVANCEVQQRVGLPDNYLQHPVWRSADAGGR